MSADFDLFTKRPFDERLDARGRVVPFADMTGHLVAAAEVVMALPEGDNRRQYAGEYLGTLFGYTERQEVRGAAGERSIEGIRGTQQLNAGVAYIELQGYGGNESRGKYGSADPLPNMANLEPGFDPDVAFWAQEGRTAVDAVMVNLILGPPAK
jgi:hypothetical protein